MAKSVTMSVDKIPSVSYLPIDFGFSLENPQKVTVCVDPTFEGRLYLYAGGVADTPGLEEINIKCSPKCSLTVKKGKYPNGTSGVSAKGRKGKEPHTRNRKLLIGGDFCKARYEADFDYSFDTPNCGMEDCTPVHYAVIDYLRNRKRYTAEKRCFDDYIKRHAKMLFGVSKDVKDQELFYRERAAKEIARCPEIVLSATVYNGLVDYFSEKGDTDMVATFMNCLQSNYNVEELNDRKERKTINKMLHPNSVEALRDIWAWKKKEDGDIKITRYKGVYDIAEIVFPEKIGRSAVTEIGENIFESSAGIKSVAVKKVVLPDSVQIIHPNAFSEMHTKLYYGHGVIKDSNWKVASVRLPAGLKCIPDNLFCGMRCLTQINIPDTVLYIGETAFSDVPADLTIPRGVRFIGQDAFQNCIGLKSVELDDCECHPSAFQNTRLEKLVLHNCVLHDTDFDTAYSLISQREAEKWPELHLYAPEAVVVNVHKNHVQKLYVHLTDAVSCILLSGRGAVLVVPDEATRIKVKSLLHTNNTVITEGELENYDH